MKLSALILFLFLAISPTFAIEAPRFQFEWGKGSLIQGDPEEPVALILPIKVNGISCTAQLDTGAPGKVIWTDKAQSVQEEELIDVKVEVGSVVMKVQAHPLNIARIQEPRCSFIAVLGNGFFENGSLYLDMKRRQFSFSHHAVLAKRRNAQPLIYPQWKEGAAGHLLVEVRNASGKLDYALLDTGSTAFGFVATSLKEWNDLTGKLPMEKSGSVVAFTVPSWGQQVNCFKTRIKKKVTIASMLSLKEYEVSHCALNNFKSPQKLLGILGLKHLSESAITLDYVSRRWMIH